MATRKMACLVNELYSTATKINATLVSNIFANYIFKNEKTRQLQLHFYFAKINSPEQGLIN